MTDAKFSKDGVARRRAPRTGFTRTAAARTELARNNGERAGFARINSERSGFTRNNGERSGFARNNAARADGTKNHAARIDFAVNNAASASEQKPTTSSRTERPDASGAEASTAVRLSKRMSELGLSSRREADEWIAKGWVKVDGAVVSELGSKVLPNQKIEIDARARQQQNERVTIILNKPLGYVSGQAEDGHEPAKVLISAQNRWKEDRSPNRFNPAQLKSLVPAGRLDINSTGLLVLTQDGRVAKTLIGENSEIEKEYIVRVAQTNGEPNSAFPADKLALLNFGLTLDGKPLQKADVSWLNEDQLKFVLREGRNRQIRRMCDLVGLKVLALKRVRVGAVTLGKLPVGKWRYLTNFEKFSGNSRREKSSVSFGRNKPTNYHKKPKKTF